MKTALHFSLTLALGAWLLAMVSTPSPAAEATNLTAAPGLAAETASALQSQRAWQTLQDQMRVMQKALEDARSESDAAVRRSQEAVAAQLKTLEQNLTAQRQREQDVAEVANRIMIIVPSVLGVIAVLILVMTFWMQMRALQRLTDAAASLRPALIAPRPAMALTAGDPFPAADSPDPAARQMQDNLRRLQLKVEEMVAATAASPSAPRNGDEPGGTPRKSGQGSRAQLLLQKAQTLVSLDRPADALDCLDEILDREPDHPEALVKRGTVLEKMERMEEALAAYERAIASSKASPTAHLLKGGLLNRLNRPAEALACYEQALGSKTPQASAAS